MPTSAALTIFEPESNQLLLFAIESNVLHGPEQLHDLEVEVEPLFYVVVECETSTLRNVVHLVAEFWSSLFILQTPASAF